MLRLLAIRLVGTGAGLADGVATLTADCRLVLIALLLSAVPAVLIVLVPIPAGIVMVAVGVPTELDGEPPQSGSDREPGSMAVMVVAATGDELAEAGTADVGVDGAGIGVTVMKLR
uniref:(northern house mosquito) hypothetical protein n=1 Tax=Culex pipiens TaxID=7175 RepID=A0A8D8G547_CULPI